VLHIQCGIGMRNDDSSIGKVVYFPRRLRCTRKDLSEALTIKSIIICLSFVSSRINNYCKRCADAKTYKKMLENLVMCA
jgi:hypothetical protein